MIGAKRAGTERTLDIELVARLQFILHEAGGSSISLVPNMKFEKSFVWLIGYGVVTRFKCAEIKAQILPSLESKGAAFRQFQTKPAYLWSKRILGDDLCSTAKGKCVAYIVGCNRHEAVRRCCHKRKRNASPELKHPAPLVWIS